MNDMNKSYLTEEAKNDINQLLGGGSGLFVVTTAQVSNDGQTAEGDMTKGEIIDALRNGKIVILRLQKTGDGLIYHSIIVMAVGNLNAPYYNVANFNMSMMTSNDNTTWTYIEIPKT